MSANDVPLSPLSFLQRAADVFPTKVAVIEDDGSTFTYATLRDRAARLADALRDAGIRPGDRVAILAPNTAPLLEAHYGVPGAAAALVPLNTRLAPREFAHILNHSGARVLLLDTSLAGAIAPIRERLETVELIVDLPADQGTPLGDVGYDGWLDAAPRGPGLVAPADERATISINYTSGTTGEPKGVMCTHRGAYLNALGDCIGFGLSPRTVYLWTLPMFHCNGWCFTWAISAVGGTHVCMRKFEPGRALALIALHGVTHFCGAPVVLNAIAHDPAAGQVRFEPPVRAALGGAPPSPTLIALMEGMGIAVTHLYGLTETYGPATVCEPQPSWPELAPSARAALVARQGVRGVNVEGVRVVDAALRDVPADGATMGEVIMRSNTVMAGYFQAPEATAAAFQGGWFHSGDLGVMHPDGYVEVRDRSKDIIISGGENISSIEVENVLAAHPAVLEAAVVAAADEKWGEVPVAFVTLKPDSAATAAELIAHVRANLAHFKAPKAVIFGALPKTSTGKIQKFALRTTVRERFG